MQTKVAVVVVGLLMGVLSPGAPRSLAHAGEGFCDAKFAGQGVGPASPADGSQEGHGEGRCRTTFRGFPMGVIGRYEVINPKTGSPDRSAPAEIHVEVWLHLAGYAPQKIAECQDGNPAMPGGKERFGTAQCEAEGSWHTGVPVPLPASAPDQAAYIECLAHSHARVKRASAPTARFGCYSSDSAEAELRKEMRMPAGNGKQNENGGGSGGGGGGSGGASPTSPPGAIVSITPNAYDLGRTVVRRDSEVTYLNLDIGAHHDVVARTATRPPGSAPWCGDRRFVGKCPLFYTPLIVGSPGSRTRVQGLEQAKPGDYEFYCTIHKNMRPGTITVIAS